MKFDIGGWANLVFDHIGRIHTILYMQLSSIQTFKHCVFLKSGSSICRANVIFVYIDLYHPLYMKPKPDFIDFLRNDSSYKISVHGMEYRSH